MCNLIQPEDITIHLDIHLNNDSGIQCENGNNCFNKKSIIIEFI